ncbi:MAG TPA: ribokinase [Streptosporangiaceae bacterium]|nr:ribokinase [Streptosporangiaceae bacterium]
MGRVIVVGSINVDLTFRVSQLPLAGETVIASGYEECPGGKGANQAVAAARAGAQVMLIGRCGDDEAGRLSLADLRAEGIDVSGVIVDSEHRTGRAVIVVDDEGENQIVVSPGANSRSDAPSTVARLGNLRSGDVVLISFEVPEDVTVAAVTAAKAGGASVVVNPAPVRELHQAILGACVILTPNEAEATALGGDADVASAAAAISAMTRGPVVVTRGALGVLLHDGRQVHQAPALAGKAVDTTGAGDTFSGVLAARLAEGAALADAVPTAIVAASLSTRAEGPRKGIPVRAEIDRRVRGARHIHAALRELR